MLFAAYRRTVAKRQPQQLEQFGAYWHRAYPLPPYLIKPQQHGCGHRARCGIKLYTADSAGCRFFHKDAAGVRFQSSGSVLVTHNVLNQRMASSAHRRPIIQVWRTSRQPVGAATVSRQRAVNPALIIRQHFALKSALRLLLWIPFRRFSSDKAGA